MNKEMLLTIGIDWSRAAKHQAMVDLKIESPKVARIINVLDRKFRNRKA